MSDEKAETLEAVERFLEAMTARSPDALVASMTEDCVFEDTDPRPNGTRYQGNEVIAQFFAGMGPEDSFEIEEKFACGDRCVILWNYHWVRNGAKGNNRGADIFRVRDGKVAEKLAYTKNG